MEIIPRYGVGADGWLGRRTDRRHPCSKKAAVTEPTSHPVRPDTDPRSTPSLIAAATRDASAQLADLLRLARIEMRGNVRAVATLALLFGGAALLILVSLVLLLLSVRDAIAVLVGSDAIAALIVALPFLFTTAILMWAGLRRMSLREVPRGKTPHRS